MVAYVTQRGPSVSLTVMHPSCEAPTSGRSHTEYTADQPGVDHPFGYLPASIRLPWQRFCHDVTYDADLYRYRSVYRLDGETTITSGLGRPLWMRALRQEDYESNATALGTAHHSPVSDCLCFLLGTTIHIYHCCSLALSILRGVMYCVVSSADGEALDPVRVAQTPLPRTTRRLRRSPGNFGATCRGHILTIHERITLGYSPRGLEHLSCVHGRRNLVLLPLLVPAPGFVPKRS